MNKYHARPTKVDGIRFDSKGEARRYGDLKILERAGEIEDLTLQPEFELMPRFKRRNPKRKRGWQTVPAIVYRADFQYYENGRLVVEDYKGVETAVFRLKRKLFWAKYPEIELRITR